ncbi:MAG: hypothetical protein E6H47_04980 [Betaproteobacteria bacterium]|nr:MAG: hypothetical protein E6H47_04980 [Betaproteobacteria bacterium]
MDLRLAIGYIGVSRKKHDTLVANREKGRLRMFEEMAMTSPRAEFLDLYRAGVKSAVDLMKTSLESQVKTLDELIALQASMAGDQFVRAVDYWSELCRAAGENQAAAIGQMQEQVAKARDWISQEPRRGA